MSETMNDVYKCYKGNAESMNRGSGIYRQQMQELLSRTVKVFEMIQEEMSVNKEVSVNFSTSGSSAYLHVMIPKDNYRFNLRVSPLKCIFSYIIYYDMNDNETSNMRPKVSFSGRSANNDSLGADDFREFGTSANISKDTIYKDIVQKFAAATEFKQRDN